MNKFSVATFNLFNLNEPGLPMYKDTQGWSQEQYNRKIEVHGMHLSALGAAVSTIRRTAEAAAMRVILNLVLKNTDQPVIVIGGINDGQSSNTQNECVHPLPPNPLPRKGGGVPNRRFHRGSLPPCGGGLGWGVNGYHRTS